MFSTPVALHVHRLVKILERVSYAQQCVLVDASVQTVQYRMEMVGVYSQVTVQMKPQLCPVQVSYM